MKLHFLGIIKAKSWLLFAGFFTIAFETLGKYIFQDWSFLPYLVAMMTLDTLFGVGYAIRKGSLSTKGFGMVIQKIIVYGAALELTHLLTHFQVNNVQNVMFGWFGTFVYSALMSKETLSIIININKIKPGFFPAWIMKKFADFNEKGELIHDTRQ